MDNQSRLETYEKLSQRFHLIPLRKNGKKPIDKNWTQWCVKKRSFKIDDFKNGKGVLNAGIPTGPANGIIGVDIDNQELFDRIAKERGWTLPATRKHYTGNLRPHYIFQYPDDGHKYRTKSFKSWGFDIRALGGQLVAPGSIHPNTGRAYACFDDNDIAPEEAPKWLLELCREEEEPAKSIIHKGGGTWGGDILHLPISSENKKLIIDGRPVGERSEAIMTVLNALVWSNLDDHEILEIFESYTIGEKYMEQGKGRERWLSPQINKARSYVTDRADPPKQARNDVSSNSTTPKKLEIVQEPKQEATATPTISNSILKSFAFRQLKIPAKTSFLHPWMKEQTIALLIGWRGIGKTMFAMSACNAISRGAGFGPWEGSGPPVNCLYLDGEMAASDVQERLAMLPSSKNFYVYCDAYSNLQGLPRANLLNPQWREVMQNILKEKDIKLWFVDNIASLSPGADENSKKDWDPVNTWLLDLRFQGIATVLLHHTGKEGQQRGTSGREDNIDVSIALKRPTDYVTEDGARFVVHFSKARVPTADLSLMADMEFKLGLDDRGAMKWTFGSVKQKTKVEVLKMLDEGFAQAEIAKTLDKDKGYISRIKKQAMSEGFLTSKGRLSQSGAAFCSCGK